MPHYMTNKELAIPEEAAIADVPRCGDAQRDRYLGHLSDCHARGYLDADAYETRRNMALAAQFLPQLKAVVADLPPAPLRRTGLPKTRRDKPLLQTMPFRPIMHGLAVIPILTLAVVPSLFWGSTHHISAGAATGMLFTIGAGAIAFVINLVWLMTWVDNN